MALNVSSQILSSMRLCLCRTGMKCLILAVLLMIREAAMRTSLEFLLECVRKTEGKGVTIILVIRSALIRRRDLQSLQRDRLSGRDGAEASSQK